MLPSDQRHSLTVSIVAEGRGPALAYPLEVQRLVGVMSPSEPDRPLREHTHPEDLAQLDAVESAVASGDAAAAEVRLLAADGVSRWFSVLAMPTRDSAGRVVGHVAAWRDMDGEMSLREDLVDSERRFRLLAETASDIVYEAGADRCVTWVSSSIERALGWTPEDLVGTWMSDLVHPDDLAWSTARRDRIYAGDPEAEAEGSFVLRLRTKDGGYRWVSTTLTTHRADDGTPMQFTGGMKVIDDVMEERQRLAESEERFRLLAENAADVVYLMRDQRAVWVSPSVTAVLGWSAEEWLAGGFDEYAHPDDADEIARCREDVARGGRAEAEVRARTRDGAYRWVQVNAGPFVDADGRRDGIVASFRVIDEQVAARRELERRATYDELTGALKRGPALDRLETAEDGFAVLYVDLDGFKEINDTWGHAVGDTVLTSAVERMAALVGGHDAVARVGGDEFLVLLTGAVDRSEAEAVADAIRAALAEPVPTPAGPVVVTGSVGIALRRPGEAPEATVTRADREMYRAKGARGAAGRRSGADRRA